MLACLSIVDLSHHFDAAKPNSPYIQKRLVIRTFEALFQNQIDYFVFTFVIIIISRFSRCPTFKAEYNWERHIDSACKGSAYSLVCARGIINLRFIDDFYSFWRKKNSCLGWIVKSSAIWIDPMVEMITFDMMRWVYDFRSRRQNRFWILCGSWQSKRIGSHYFIFRITKYILD